MKIKIYGIAFALLIHASLGGQAMTRQNLLSQAKALYERLPTSDAARPGLALRYADLLFESSVEVSSDVKATEKEMRLADVYSQTAHDLYTQVLNGFGQKFTKPEGELKVRVQFQLARVSVQLAKTQQANELWKILSEQTLIPLIQTESCLQLAEHYELSSDRDKIAEARRLYKKVLASSTHPDAAPYVLHRIGWAEYRLGQPLPAIQYLKSSLEKAAVSLRADILADTVLFYSRSSASAETSLKELRSLARRYSLPDPGANLVKAYSEADKRAEQARVLQQLDKERPQLATRIDLLDLLMKEQGDYAAFLQKTIEDLRTGRLDRAVANDESEKKLFQIIAHWDGERRAGRAKSQEILGQSVRLFAMAFPQSPQLAKVLDGWYVAQPDTKEQKAWIDVLLQGTQRNITSPVAAERLLRLRRAHLLRAESNWSEAALDFEYVAAVSPSADKRQVQYEWAKSLRQAGHTAQALQIFQSLADLTSLATPDEVAVFSQNSALDILSEQKRYDDVVRQTQMWTANKKIKTTIPRMKSELLAQENIANNAEFEKHATEKSKESLVYFTQKCREKKFFPTSCENLEALANAQNESGPLFLALQQLERLEDLAVAYEKWGYFSQAGKTRERLGIESFDKMMRVSILFELDGEWKERDRILKIWSQKEAPKKLAELNLAQQSLWLTTLREVQLLDAKAWGWNWQESLRPQLAYDLELAKKSNKTIAAYLQKNCTATVPPTDGLVAELKQIDKQQSQILFYGSDSERQFKKRVATLDQMKALGECLAARQVEVEKKKTSAALAFAYQELAEQILQTPLPKGLSAPEQEAVSLQLKEMAKPFQAVANEFSRSLTSTDFTENKTVAFRFWESSAEAVAQDVKAHQFYGEFSKEFRKNPFDKSSLEKWKAQFEVHKQVRASSYLGGRLEALNQMGEGPKEVKQ